MRILSFTAGAGAMLCGSCIRDNALARALAARGHEVRLVPLYAKTRTDETNVSEERVRFGGVSVWAQHAAPLFRKTPLLDWLFDSTPAIEIAGRLGASTAPEGLGPLTVTTLKGEAGAARRAVERFRLSLAGEQPDLVVLPNSLLLGLAAPLRRSLGCPLVVTFSGEDLFLARLPPNHREESLRLMRQAAPAVTRFVGVSEHHAHDMARCLGISEERVSVVRLGVDGRGFPASPRSRRKPGAVRIGFFSRIAPEKGLDRLARAVAILSKKQEMPALELHAAGWMAGKWRGWLATIEKEFRRDAPSVPFRYHGSPDRDGKIAFLADMDLIGIPAAFPEAKGLPAIEAMTAGTPVVAPAAGAYPRLMERTGGGALARSAAPEDVSEALEPLVRSEDRRIELGARGFSGAREHHSVEAMAEDAEAAYRKALAA